MKVKIVNDKRIVIVENWNDIINIIKERIIEDFIEEYGLEFTIETESGERYTVTAKWKKLEE